MQWVCLRIALYKKKSDQHRQQHQDSASIKTHLQDTLGEDLGFVGETHTAVTVKQWEHLLNLFNTALPSKLTSTTCLDEEDLGFVEEGGAVAVVKQQEYLLQRDFFAICSEHEPFLPVTQEADDAGIGTCMLRPGGKLPQLFHHSLFG